MHRIVEYNIMNHYRRNVKNMVSQFEKFSRDVKVNTDKTDFYKTRNSDRYKGINDNYFGILDRKTNCKWKVIMHDDIDIYENMLLNIEHILSNAPNVIIVNFYNPTTKRIKKAVNDDTHIIEHFNQFWGQCSAYNVSYMDELVKWVKKNTIWGEGAEDLKVEQYCSHNSIPMYTVVPSIAQHIGYKRSTFKNPASIVGVKRNSFNYSPTFDSTKIDWEYEFKNCLKDKTKIYGGLGMPNKHYERI